MSTVRTGKLKLTRSEKKLFLVTGCLIALILAAGLWWQWLNADPVVHIPTPQMPNPNAFDFYVKAGDALVRSNQIGDAIRVQPPGVKADPKLYPTYSLAQKQALLQMNLPALRLLHQGFAYKYQQPPERSLSSNSFPQFARFRELARLLVLEGQVKAAHGDKTGAVNSYLDAVRLGSDVQRGAPLIGALTGYAIEAIGRGGLWQLLPHLDASATRAAVRRLEKLIEQRVTFAETMQEEKWSGQARQLESMRNGQWRPTILWPGVIMRDRIGSILITKRTVMNNYTKMMDALIADAHRPYALRQPLPPPSDIYTAMLAPIFEKSRWNTVRNEANNTLLLVMLALRTFHLESGGHPTQLPDLVPSYLKRVPIDPFGRGEPLHYRRTGSTYVLWSIGPDGLNNRGHAIDNKRPVGNTSRSYPRLVLPESKGDIVAGINR